MLFIWLLSILWLLFFVQGVVWIFGDDDICGGWFPVYTKWEFFIFVNGQVYEMYTVVDFLFYCKIPFNDELKLASFDISNVYTNIRTQQLPDNITHLCKHNNIDHTIQTEILKICDTILKQN